MAIFQIFVDLTQVFDTRNRNALWNILKKLGYPNEFVSVLGDFQEATKTRVNVGGNLKIV